MQMQIYGWLVQTTKKPPFQPDLPKQKGRPTKGFKMGSHMIHVNILEPHTKADKPGMPAYDLEISRVHL